MGATLVLGFMSVFAFSQTVWAQAAGPLNLAQNYFVTGDYVVGGVGLRGTGVNGLATGTINIPDTVQAQATGVASPGVPAGADIVAAFLYWETVESSNSLPPHPGQNGFFNGYPIVGTVRGNPNAPTSWSAGGCSGSSQGSKTIVAYRADVRPYLPQDSNGIINANGSFTVKLADSGSNGGGVPLTLGASLVIVYRVISPTVPLSSVVIYDGAFAPSNASSILTQDIIGFYQAGTEAPGLPLLSKITHIVGDGQPNKAETVALGAVNLPSLYTNYPGVAFPGIYNGSWDNPTWSFPANGSPISTNESSATTIVTPGSGNAGSGCVDWGVIVFSTTVQDGDRDGLLDAWKQHNPPGYTDALSGQFVALPGAKHGEKDIFAEIDYLTNLDGSAGPYKHSHLPKQQALDKVGDAFANKGFHVHFDVGPNYAGRASTTFPFANPDPYIIQSGAGGNAISEGLFLCSDSATLCAFKGSSTIGWKAGFLFVKNNATTTDGAKPLGNFQPGRKDSYHYVLFGHALGSPRTYWSAAAGSGGPLANSGIAALQSIVVSGGMATVTVMTPPGLLAPGNPACLATGDQNCDRVTVSGALNPQNAALNGTYAFSAAVCTANCASLTMSSTTTFTIQTSGVSSGTYNFSTEPELGLSYGGPTSTSGHSDVGGGDTAVTFGLWPADDVPGCQADPSQALNAGQVYCTNQVGTITAEAGTLLHELGHTFYLTHGGSFFPNGASNGVQGNSPPGVPSYGLNCNPAYLSSMNYLFQIRGFPGPVPGAIDYSGQTLPDLSEAGLSETNGIGTSQYPNETAVQYYTRWYGPPSALDNLVQNNTVDGTVSMTPTVHCDGTPILETPPPTVRVDGNTVSSPIDWNDDLVIPDAVSWQDVNFNGSTSQVPDAPLRGFNDWVNLDLRQIGARWNVFGFSGGGVTGAAGGGITGAAGGGVTGAAGGGVTGAAGGGDPADPGSGVTGAVGGGVTGAAGGGITGAAGGGNEQDSDTANSTADPPNGLTAALVSKGKAVALNWSAPDFGQIRTYYIWRKGSTSSFTNIGKVTGSPPLTTFTDTTVRHDTYTYFVTDVNAKGVQSAPSQSVTITVK